MANWSSGLFECFTPANACFMSFCCPCVTFGRTRYRLTTDKDLNGYSACNGACALWCLAAHFGLHCVPNIIQRGDIRDRSSPRLSGGVCGDFMKGWCCSCCDLIQQDKEAARLLNSSADVPVTQQPGAYDQQMQYQPQQGMGYPPQHQQQPGYEQQPGYGQQPNYYPPKG